MTGDPSTETWREALGESTSAKLRRVEAELGSALDAYGRATTELSRVRDLLADSYTANYQLICKLQAARAAHADCPTRSAP